ncbi:Mov34/MPN/PAD-1 [Lasiodiplodia theobromae]|uniref:AMSH-like protease sst2 n=1 Tax=Lasiodiplodia theobromae TaxID=45133 RepID=A0A5N5DLH5_9PEZI|nr:AMSH-like protease sst2 [Lasiodiplodia theobromae]KAF9638536.1 Mov34/MPN/PAD-1 [Lasiodiplodia theobromae]
MASFRISEPLSVEEIVHQAGNFDYNQMVPLRYWLRSADTIQKEARIYEREGNDQQAYLLLFRHATLILEKLQKHPEAKDPANKQALQEARKIVNRNLPKLEELKPRINKRHQRFQEIKKDAERKRAAAQRQTVASPTQMARDLDHLVLHSRKSSDPALFGRKQALDAGENRDLAVKIAQKEIRRRDLAKRKVRQAGVSDEEEAERRTGGMWNNWEDDLASDGAKEEPDDLSQLITQVGRRGQEAVARRRGSVDPEPSSPHTAAYHYPHVPQKSNYEPYADSGMRPLTPTSVRAPPLPEKAPLRSPVSPPSIPRKIAIDQEGVAPPPLPGKYLDSDVSSAPSRSASATPPPPQELDSGDYTFKPTAFLENGTPLRTVFIPPTLRTEFLRVASPNTRKNLETCGILCGTLISNALFISRLLIPDQESTSDTCETINESAIFDYCDSEDLMVLGWIHTHPTQTCFMSSRDLHTHCGYQVMLPESIAIVCAPSKDPSWGIFRLTDPPGLKAILNCNAPGIFHPHAETNIYTDAKRPGHVFEAPGLDFQVVDLRPGH